MVRWETYRGNKLKTELPQYLEQLKRLAGFSRDTYLLEELQLWAENVMPADL
jgi:hypothetical protein